MWHTEILFQEANEDPLGARKTDRRPISHSLGVTSSLPQTRSQTQVLELGDASKIY